MRAANTGLTEGSTPSSSYDPDVVIINTLRLDKIHVLEGGRQIVCLAGATPYKLAQPVRLNEPAILAPIVVASSATAFNWD